MRGMPVSVDAIGGVGSQPGIRPDFVPKDAYISPEVARLELEKFWPRVWQVACREEELKAPGDFVTYDIGCSEFEFHALAPGALVFGLNDRVYTMRPARAGATSRGQGPKP